jgi:hypothetical protein
MCYRWERSEFPAACSKGITTRCALGAEQLIVACAAPPQPQRRGQVLRHTVDGPVDAIDLVEIRKIWHVGHVERL